MMIAFAHTRFGTAGTMGAWDVVLLALLALAASAIVGALVTLAYVLIRRSGRRLHHD